MRLPASALLLSPGEGGVDNGNSMGLILEARYPFFFFSTSLQIGSSALWDPLTWSKSQWQRDSPVKRARLQI